MYYFIGYSLVALEVCSILQMHKLSLSEDKILDHEHPPGKGRAKFSSSDSASHHCLVPQLKRVLAVSVRIRAGDAASYYLLGDEDTKDEPH